MTDEKKPFRIVELEWRDGSWEPTGRVVNMVSDTPGRVVGAEVYPKKPGTVWVVEQGAD